MSDNDHSTDLTLGEVDRNIKETRELLDTEVRRLRDAVSHTRRFSQWAIGLIALIFTALSIYAAISIWSQTSFLSDFRESITDDIISTREELEADIARLLGSGNPPVLTTWDPSDLRPLTEGHVLNLGKHMDGSDEWWSFLVVLRNNGGSTTGPIFSKVVTKDPLKLPDMSSSDRDFQYETVIEPSDRYGDSIPAGMSRCYEYILNFDEDPPSGDHQALLIHYYGNRESRRDEIILRVP